MRIRIGSLALAAVLSASMAGCEKTGEKEQKAEGVANKQAEQAQVEAYQNAAAAQAEADQKIAAARAAFDQAREEYRHARQDDLDTLNLAITKLEIRARDVTGKTKLTLETTLPSLRAQRDAFANDMKSLQASTPATWDDTKSRLDKEWSALKASVDGAP
jgi:hypothetical protein